MCNNKLKETLNKSKLMNSCLQNMYANKHPPSIPILTKSLRICRSTWTYFWLIGSSHCKLRLCLLRAIYTSIHLLKVVKQLHHYLKARYLNCRSSSVHSMNKAVLLLSLSKNNYSPKMISKMLVSKKKL